MPTELDAPKPEFLSHLQDYYAYMRMIKDNAVEYEVSMRFDRLAGIAGLVAKDDSAVLLSDGNLVINGQPLKPRKWGTRTAKSGRTYDWVFYVYGEYTIFVSVFRAEKEGEREKA